MIKLAVYILAFDKLTLENTSRMPALVGTAEGAGAERCPACLSAISSSAFLTAANFPAEKLHSSNTSK